MIRHREASLGEETRTSFETEGLAREACDQPPIVGHYATTPVELGIMTVEIQFSMNVCKCIWSPNPGI